MNQASAPAAVDVEEENLNRAISELRGVLREEGSPAGAFAATGDDGFGAAAAAGGAPTGIIMNIPVDVQIVLGSTEMQVSELMSLRKGATVALNRKIGEPVDVIVNGRRIARGEITVLESDPSRFGIRLTEIISTSKTS